MADFEVVPIDGEGPLIIDELPTEEAGQAAPVDDIPDDPSVPEGGEPGSVENAPEPEPYMLSYASEVDELPTEDTYEEPVIDDEPDGGEQPYEPDTNPNITDIPIIGTADEGQQVVMMVRDGSPVAVGSVGSGDRVMSEAREAQQRIDETITRTEANETAIEQNAQQIALKADASSVYTKTQTDGLISQEVTDRNSAIEQSAESITSSVSATYATKTEVGQKADSSTVTALSTRVTQTETDVTTAITGVNGLKALVRQYGQGVLVCRKGNTIGALVNADGSFDVVRVTWSGATPTAGGAIAKFGASSVDIGAWGPNTTAGDTAAVNFYGGSGSLVFTVGETRDSVTLSAGSVKLSTHDGVFVTKGIGGGYTNKEVLVKPDVLYSNGTGTSGTVTLSKTAADYNMMRIYFRKNGDSYANGSVDLQAPNGRRASLFLVNAYDNAKAPQLLGRDVVISAKTISAYRGEGFLLQNDSLQLSTSLTVNIIKVVAWNA